MHDTMRDTISVDAERQAVAAAARAWIGTRFHHRACIKGVGVDCAQFPVAVYRELALIDEPTIEPYPFDWFLHQDRERFLEVVSQYCVSIETPDVGDIALFRYGRTVSHAAIVVTLLPELTVIHSARATGVVMEECGSTTPLGVRLVGFWRLRRWSDA